MTATTSPMHVYLRTIPLAAAVALAFAACGDPKDGSATGGETETTAGTDAWGSAGSSTGGPGACPVPPDEAPSPDAATEIVIRNETDAVQYLLPFFLACDSELVGLSVEGFGMDLPFSHRPPAACRDAAGEIAPEQFCAWGCSDGTYPGLALAPGAEHAIPWDGSVWTWTNLLAAGCSTEEVCADVPGGDALECQGARAIPPGTPITVRAGVTSTCPVLETDPDACDCATGSCPLSVYDLGAPAPERTISADAAAGQPVELTIPP